MLAIPKTDSFLTFDSNFAQAWDTPFMGQRGNVVEALEGLGATVITKDNLEDFMEPTQLLKDYTSSGIGSKWFAWFDWYWLNVEGFFETVFGYGGEDYPVYGPVWEGQSEYNLFTLQFIIVSEISKFLMTCRFQF